MLLFWKFTLLRQSQPTVRQTTFPPFLDCSPSSALKTCCELEGPPNLQQVENWSLCSSTGSVILSRQGICFRMAHISTYKCEKHWTRTPFVSYSHLGMAVRWSGFSQQCEGSGIWSELPPWTAGRRSPYRAKHSEPPPVSHAIAAYLSRDKRKDQEFCLWDLLLQFRVGSVILCQSLKSAFSHRM